MMAAKTAPTAIAMARRSGALAMTPWSDTAAVVPMNAPTLIKPAWPSDSSPITPTVRLSETAMTT